jgi:DNA-binding Lrp family transcriptional regulator
VDRRDFQLLSLLYQDPLRSHASLGRSLGVTPAAARRRLERLRERGVLQGWWALPAASALGLEERILAFEGGRWDDAAARRALQAPGVVWVALKHDGDATVQVYAEPGRPTDPGAEKALGRAPARTHANRGRPHAPLTALDWRVVAAVLDAPAATVGPLAQASGLSPKTVRRRREALRGAGLLDVQPLLGPLEEEGLLLFHVGVFARRPLAWEAVEAAAPGAVLVHRIDDPPSLYLFCQAPDLGGAFALKERLQALPGVADVRLSVNRALLVNTPRLRAWVADRLRAAAPKRAHGAR